MRRDLNSGRLQAHVCRGVFTKSGGSAMPTREVELQLLLAESEADTAIEDARELYEQVERIYASLVGDDGTYVGDLVSDTSNPPPSDHS